VLVRARKMAGSKLRTEGKWTAGFYFNNALFRTSAVYHRSLKILTGNEEGIKGLKDLGPLADRLYQKARGVPWANESVRKVHCEVNGLKHTSGGISSGRDVPFEIAVRAVEEILEIVEALK
jgi:hypothetical protein